MMMNVMSCERLDRAVADGEWRAWFPTFKVTNGDPKHSDHRPVIMETDLGETHLEAIARLSVSRLGGMPCKV